MEDISCQSYDKPTLFLFTCCLVTGETAVDRFFNYFKQFGDFYMGRINARKRSPEIDYDYGDDDNSFLYFS